MEDAAFEWVSDLNRILDCLKKSTFLRKQDALVLGCGSSLLSEKLVSEFCYRTVVSMDNDRECIDKMKTKYHDSMSSALHWVYADIITGDGLTDCSSLVSDGKFDMIFDKGTLDAVIVEGAVYDMLINIHKLLRIDGEYYICSLSPSNLFAPLLSIPVLGFDVTIMAEASDSSDAGTILKCRKKFEQSFDAEIVQKVQMQEKVIMDEYFQSKNTLLTETMMSNLRSLYLKDAALPIKDVFHAIFNADLNALGYTYELFLEDFKTMFATKVSANDYTMTLSDACLFLQNMQ